MLNLDLPSALQSGDTPLALQASFINNAESIKVQSQPA
jgi:hypothetical protein